MLSFHRSAVTYTISLDEALADKLRDDSSAYLEIEGIQGIDKAVNLNGTELTFHVDCAVVLDDPDRAADEVVEILTRLEGGA